MFNDWAKAEIIALEGGIERLRASHAYLLYALEELVAEFDATADDLPPGYALRDTGGITLARHALAKAKGA